MILISSHCRKVINLRTHQRFAKEMLNTEYCLVWILWLWMAFQQEMLQRRVPDVFNSNIQFLIFSLTHIYMLPPAKVHNFSYFLPVTGRHQLCQSKNTPSHRDIWCFFRAVWTLWCFYCVFIFLSIHARFTDL